MQQDPFGGDAPAQTTLAPEDQRLIEHYVRAGRTLDALPYTAEFEHLYQALSAVGDTRGRRAIFHRLHNLRKTRRLPRLGRADDTPVRLTPEDESLLAQLVTGAAGSLGQRDRLPYTPQFDDLHAVFYERTGRSLNHHDLWRLIARLAK